MDGMKLVALGIAAALVVGCSDDDKNNSCNPNVSANVWMEQGYQSQSAGEFTSSGSNQRKAIVTAKNLSDGRTRTNDTTDDRDISQILDGFPDFQIEGPWSARFLVDDSGRYRIFATAPEKKLVSKMNTSLDQVFWIDDQGVSELRNMMDEMAKSEGIRVCSSGLEILLTESSVDSKEKSIVVNYTVRGVVDPNNF